VLKKSITYTDLSGQEVTEDHYFHLSKADLVELEMSHKGGLGKWIEHIVESEDGKAIVTELKKIILMSYGVKSEDGRRFVKTQELRDDFASSEAYSTLFVSLCTDAGAAAEFISGIVPADMEQEASQVARTHPSDTAATPVGRNVFEGGGQPEADPTAVEPRVLTRQELTEMDDAELRTGLAEGRYKLS
jgi:hypothetical protein